MYLEHFGLSEPPFTITPHTDFFFAGANRGATLAALIYAITHGEGIVKVSGEVGSGKTMLCRVLMERLPESVVTIYLAIPSLNRDEMLAAICADLGLVVERATPSALIRALQGHLLWVHAQGRRVIALIDEAHAMPLDSLEEIRLLSNLETNKSKLLQIALFGQPELDENLAKPQMRQLRERITHGFQLSPLTLEDIKEYLRHRLWAAGYRGAEVFSLACVKLIAKASEGLSRRVNIIADKSLLAAFSQGAHSVTPAHVRAAVRDCDFAAVESKSARTPWVAAAAMAAGLIIGALGMGWIAKHGEQAREPPVAIKADGKAVPVVQSEAANPTPVVPPEPVHVTAAEPVRPTRAATPAPQSLPAAPSQPDATLPQRLAAARPWLQEQPGSSWVIQLMLANANEVNDLRQFIDDSERSLGPGTIHAYSLTVNGIEKVSVIYGSFPDRSAAMKALATLPPRVSQFNPYLRNVQLIHNEAEYGAKQPASG